MTAPSIAPAPAPLAPTLPADVPESRRWMLASHGFGLAAAAVVAWYVAHIPVQMSDSLGNLLQVRAVSYQRLFFDQLIAKGFLRPLLWVQIKLAYDVAGGHYWLAFKAIHTLQLLAMAVLTVRLLRVRSYLDAAAVPLVMAVVFGLHTFNGTVREAHPVNAFLTMVVCVLLAINLSTLRPRLRVDVFAAVLLAFAALTVESGLLVGVALVAGRLVGLKGVSRGGVVVCLAVVAGYLALRFGVVQNGFPGLDERSSGFGVRVLDPSELMARFGARPLVLYAYNVLAALMTVLFSEPRGGVFELGKRWVLNDDVPEWLALDIGTSLLTTMLCTVWGIQAIRRWRARRTSYADRVAGVACAVLVANAVMSYGYTKDVIMSPGGVCFALVVYAAVRSLAEPAVAPVAGRIMAAVLVSCVAAGWAVRAAALPVLLTEWAFKTRNDWATVYPWLEGQRIAVTLPEERALVETLRRAALNMPVPHPDRPVPGYFRYFDLQ